MLYTRFIRPILVTVRARPITRKYKPPCSPACSRQVGHRTKDMFNGSAELAERLDTGIGSFLSFRERFVSLAFLVNVAAQAQSSQLFFIRLTTVGTISSEIA